MRFIERMFGVVNYKRMEETLNAIIAEGEETRNRIRRESLEAMSKLSPKQDAEAIQTLLIDMNTQISSSYEKELYLRKFVDLLK